MKEKLLSDFTTVTKAQWQAKIVDDLKGKSFESLLWESEGLIGGPIYAEEDIKTIPNLESVQNNNFAANPETYGSRHWTNYQLIIAEDEADANKAALAALNLGADGLVFGISHIPDFYVLLNEIQSEYCAISFELTNPTKGFVDVYKSFLDKSGTNLNGVNGFISSPTTTSKEIEAMVASSNLKCLNIDIPPAFNSVNVVQELALLLYFATSEISNLTVTGSTAKAICSTTQFQVRLGKNYFIEIAKIRALRLLASALWKGFDLDVKPNEIFVLSASSNWNEPVEDKYNHLLEATTSAMSAIIGGCSALLIRPFNTTFEDQPALAIRNARNISSILKEEAYLDKNVDPAAGSYFIESITNQLIDNAWSLFLKLEATTDQNDITLELLNNITSKVQQS